MMGRFTLRIMAAPLLAAAALTLMSPPAHAQTPASVRIAYVAIGDSITHRGSESLTGWVNEYANHLKADLDATVAVTNLGVDNATSADVLARVRDAPWARSAIAASDVVTYQVGINDFLRARGQFVAGACGGDDHQDCLRTMAKDFANNWDALVREIRTLAPKAVLRGLDIYYAPAAFDQKAGIFDILNGYLTQMNEHILRDVAAPVADIHTAFNGHDGRGDPFNGGYLLDDDVHPNWLGELVISGQMRSLGYAGLPGSQRFAPAAGRGPQGTAAAAAGTAARPTASGGPGCSRSLIASATGGGIALIAVLVAGGAWYRRHRRRAASKRSRLHTR